MIKSFKIRNYRSLRNVVLNPGLRNIFVGPNASGKSNSLDVFRFFRDIASLGLSRAISNRGGFSEVFWKGESTDRIIEFELDLEMPVGSEGIVAPVQYHLAIEGSQSGLITVKRELLKVSHASSDVSVIDMRSGHGNVRQLDGSLAFEPSGDPSASMLDFNVPNWPGTAFKQYLIQWRYYSLIPVAMKQLKPFVRANFLEEHGENLVEYLTTLKTTYAESFREIERVAKDTFPELDQLIPEPNQTGQVLLTLREKFLRTPITAWNMAEGEISFIALLSLILAPAELGSPITCVEEPENHLHPRLLETLAELLKQTEAKFIERGDGAAQIFATTHSPYLVDQFDIGDLIVVEKLRGETSYTRPRDKTELQQLISREKLGLGELWYSGALGGV
jgi:predicted ATPase